MSEPAPASSKLEELRRAFDRGFAVPAAAAGSAGAESYLALRAAGERVAVRLAEARGLLTGRKITPIPSRLGELLGLAAIRGKCVPVYSAAALLGYGTASREARWFVLCAGRSDAEALALAFDGFEGYLSVPKSRARAVPAAERPREHVAEVLESDAGARAVVDIASIMKAVERRIETGQEKANG